TRPGAYAPCLRGCNVRSIKAVPRAIRESDRRYTTLSGLSGAAASGVRAGAESRRAQPCTGVGARRRASFQEAYETGEGRDELCVGAYRGNAPVVRHAGLRGEVAHGLVQFHQRLDMLRDE